MRVPIIPATLALDAGGTPVSPDYGDVYHAAEGGPGQARHVFLAGNGLPDRWQNQERFVILENGFGTGLNFLATWAAWQNDPQRCTTLHYLAVEKHPFQGADLARLHGQWPEFQAQSEGLRRQWPVLISGFHRLEFSLPQGHRVVLTLMLGESETCLKQLRARVDAFYLDGFDPKKNPDMWSSQVFQAMARLAAPGATLATWCVARPVRDALQHAGFNTEKRPGFARKRDMLVGHAPQTDHRGSGMGTAHRGPRHALVVGGGIAGSALAQRLAARQWRVDLLEEHPHLAGEGSGNLAGIVRPLLSRDDNIASRLNRACFLHAGRTWAELERMGFASRRSLDGVLQIARDGAHESQQRAMVAQGAYPGEYVRFLERDEASALIGWPTAFGGWWFPQGGWASPPTLCQALVDAAGPQVQRHHGQAVASLAWSGDSWRALNAQGHVLAEAEVAILATGARAQSLAQTQALPISPVRGQVSHIPAGQLPDFKHALCCEGYLTPALDGIHCLGASYAYDEGTELRVKEHTSNLDRLARILPNAESALDSSPMAGRVGFRAATPDRLPLAGALPDGDQAITRDTRLRELPRLPNLYGLLGLGSRGLVWSALAAEVLSSQLHGDPMPVEGDLLDALDPARFMLRALRKSA